MIYQQGFLLLFQQQTSAQMQTESELYRQSQEEITPIIDYIPIPEGVQLPESSRWRMKQELDESRLRTQTLHPSFQSMQPLSSLRIQSRLNTDSAGNECDKKTTSIMQGHSANTIPSNQLSINIIKDNLKSCLTYCQRQEDRNSRSHLYTNQNYSRNTEGQRWRGRSRDAEVSLHFMNERSKLLRNIDRSLEEHKTPQKERFEYRECKRQRKKLLNQILERLECTMKQKKDVELVKSNFNETEVSLNDKNGSSKQKQGGFSKKTKKWVQTKNALKSAVLDSTEKCLSSSKVLQDHQILSNAISQWKFIGPSSQFQSPPLISHPDTHQAHQIPISISSSSLYTAHKDFPGRRDEDIFTFSNIQGVPFHKHIKNVSISVSQSSSKEVIAANQQEPLMGECTLCKVIGKRCSFH